MFCGVVRGLFPPLDRQATGAVAHATADRAAGQLRIPVYALSFELPL